MNGKLKTWKQIQKEYRVEDNTFLNDTYTIEHPGGTHITLKKRDLKWFGEEIKCELYMKYYNRTVYKFRYDSGYFLIYENMFEWIGENKKYHLPDELFEIDI